MHQFYSYLALGDSYTIGESVVLTNNFPYQVVQLLRKKGFKFSAPEIIAKTGWTTDELSGAISKYPFLTDYSFVTLLIGVNNQYRGRDVLEYKMHFEKLLKKSISLAQNKADHVIVLSIPDYSITPYAKDMDKEKIAKEIEVYNSACHAVSIQYKVHFIDISEGFMKAQTEANLIVEDGLHPSQKEYSKWAKKVAAVISKKLK